MTTDPLAVRAARAGSTRAALAPLCGAAALLVLSCAHGPASRHGDRLDVSAYPPEIQRDYAVFARRCSRCHTLARPLNAHIRDSQHWVRYVTRMRRNPSSGINKEDAALILNFLLFYTAQIQKEDQAASEPEETDPEPLLPPASSTDSTIEATPAPAAPAPPLSDDNAGATPPTAPTANPGTEDLGATPPSAPPSEDALP